MGLPLLDPCPAILVNNLQWVVQALLGAAIMDTVKVALPWGLKAMARCRIALAFPVVLVATADPIRCKAATVALQALADTLLTARLAITADIRVELSPPIQLLTSARHHSMLEHTILFFSNAPLDLPSIPFRIHDAQWQGL